MLNMITNLLKLLLLVSLLSACDQSTQNKQSKRDSRAQLVIALPVERLSLSSQVQVSGSLTALRTVKILNQEPGQIENIPYFQGDNVNKGNILVYIDNDKITAQLNKNKAATIQSERNLKRLTGLRKSKLTSEYELNQARTEVTLTKAEELINQIRLNDTFIKAPFTGVISERLHEPGHIVPLNTHILTLIDNTRLIVKLQVSELLLPGLLLDNKVSVQIDALNKLNNITGHISRIYPTIDPGTRKGTFEIELDEIPDGAKPGQLSRVIIITPKIERLFIDAAAIQYDNSGKFVYRIDTKNRPRKIKVQTGIQVKNKIEIVDGLNEKDLIITEGFSNLKDGGKVKIVNTGSDTMQLKSKDNKL